jgi:DNA-directed RNA polymerase subunit RPC12/RpoP
MALMKCSECGKDVSSKAAACPHCGAPVAVAPNVTPQVESKKDVGIAILLALLLGPVGLFYSSIGGGLFMLVAAAIALATESMVLGGGDMAFLRILGLHLSE